MTTFLDLIAAAPPTRCATCTLTDRWCHCDCGSNPEHDCICDQPTTTERQTND